MKTRVHLTIGSRGSVRATKNRTPLRTGEIGLMLHLEIPDEAFRQPFAEAHIVVPDEYVIKPAIEAWLDPIEEEE